MFLKRLAVTFSLLLTTPVVAEDFYKSKQINLIISAGAGGGFSTYAQVFAPYLSKYIPGNPNINLQNMTGAGGIRAMQYLYNIAPKDGSVIGLVHSTVPFAPLYGLKGATFNPQEMNWIGSINSTEAICVSWNNTGIKTWEDVLNKEYIVGTSGAGAQSETIPAMINKLFGTKIRVISGYVGGNDIFLAMERGEIQGRCGSIISTINSTRPDWFSSNRVSVPITITLRRSIYFPDIPAIYELAKDERTKQLLKLIIVPLQLDRPLLTTPGVPPERVAILRKAFHQAMNDTDFIADAIKFNLEINEISGEEIQNILKETYNTPPEIIKEAIEAMNLTGSTTEK